MNGNLTLDQFGPISFDPGLPSTFLGQPVPGAVSIHAKGPWGVITVQELKTPRYILRYFLFKLYTSLTLRVKEMNEGLQSLLSLRGQFEYHVEGFEPFKISPSEFLLFNAGERDTRARVPEGSSEMWNIYYSEQTYSRFAPLFHNFEKDLKRSFHTPLYFLPAPKVARYKVLDSIQAIFTDRYVPHLAPHYFELQLQSSLLTMLDQTYSPGTPQSATKAQREIAHAAREMILMDIKKHISIEEITTALNCTPGWLYRAFQKVYGMGPYHLLRKTRMEKARAMLLQGYHLKWVAPEVGMAPSNFPKEFKAYFGYTVTALKKGLA